MHQRRQVAIILFQTARPEIAQLTVENRFIGMLLPVMLQHGRVKAKLKVAKPALEFLDSRVKKQMGFHHLHVDEFLVAFGTRHILGFFGDLMRSRMTIKIALHHKRLSANVANEMRIELVGFKVF